MDMSFWCEDCGQAQEEECKLHAVIHVKDRVVQSYARLTLPHVLNIKVVEFRAVGAHVHGVYPKKIIQKRTQFGPLIAPTSAKKVTLEQRLSLKIFSSLVEYSHMDLSSEDECNWMMFIRPAKKKEEQNMIAYQHDGKIFFSTTQVIPTGKELKVWYAPHYAKLMKRKLLSQIVGEVDNYHSFYSDDDMSDNDGCDLMAIEPPHLHEVLVFDCSVCKASFTEFHLFEKHICGTVSKESLMIEELVEERHDEGGNEDDSRSDDSPQKRNKRKGNPVKLSKSGRVIRPKQQPEDPKSKVWETRKRRSKRQKVSRDSQRYVGQIVLAGPDIDAKTNASDMQLIAQGKPDIHNNTNDGPITNIKLEGVKEPTARAEKELESKTETGRKREKTLHTCDICSKCYPSINRLKIHKYSHTGEKPWKCEQEGCVKAFTSKFKLDRHILIHKPKSKTHTCLHCHMSFHRKDHLKNHMRVHDPNKPVFTCDKCGREYTTSFAYRTHVGFHCAEEGSLRCFVCEKDFEDKDKLVFHLKIHAGAQSVKGIMQRKEKCPHCDKRFYTQKDVRRHVLVHTREKDYLCQYCPHRFGRRDHLIRHLRKAHAGSESLLMTYAADPKDEEEPVEPPLPPDLKSCKVEATVPPLDYEPVQQIHNLVINTSHDQPNVTLASTMPSDLEQTAQQLLETCQCGIHPAPQSNPVMTAQISPNTQYVYLRNALPTSHQYLPISSSSLSPLPGVPLQSLPLTALPGNSTQQILTKLESKPFDNLVSTLVPMLNIQCSPMEEKLSAHDLGLAVVQNLVPGVQDRHQNTSILSQAPLQHHRDLSLPSPSPSSATIDTVDHRFFPPTSHIDPDKLTLPISSPTPSATDMDTFSYVHSPQILDKLPEVNLSDRRFYVPGGHFDDIKLSDGPCVITEAQLASYVETLKVLSNLSHIPTGNVFSSTSLGQTSAAENINTVASMSYAQALPEFTHSFQ
ncbi:PR domain zinc finger protein 15-like [Lineus longissimus]|uniref:PR domain zinc finger protein 15-like n=1 Tax=Lineus longissimus TaxID=88925 RepID=UPI002B4F9A2E